MTERRSASRPLRARRSAGMSGLILLMTLGVGCAKSPTPAAAPAVTVVVPAPMQPPPPPPLAVPAGEVWLPAAEAAGIQVVRPWVATGYLVPARVGVDEQHGAHVHALRSGTVTSIGSFDPHRVREAILPGARVERGATLVTLGSTEGKQTYPIKSPIDGEVIAIRVALGDAVTGAVPSAKDATELVFVADLRQVILTTTTVPPGVKVGASVSFRPPTMPDRVFEAKVSYVAADGSQLRAAVDNMTGSLTLDLPGDLLIAHEGMAGVYLPRSALLTEAGDKGDARVLVRRGSSPDGRARFVRATVTRAFDGGASAIAVTGLGPDNEVVKDIAATLAKASAGPSASGVAQPPAAGAQP